ncbi:MAG: hypothetical protein ACFE9C_15170 [Candidatus Hodarchaeota archaeon]
MSFKSLSKKYSIGIKQEISRTKPINFTDIIIPFSEFGESKDSPDLYDGSEKIPFNERDPQYKAILKYEFAEGDLFEIHQHLIKINYLLTKLSD